MGLLSKYTKAELKKLDKKTFMKEASYDDIFTDYGITLNVLIMCRESTAHEEQKKASTLAKLKETLEFPSWQSGNESD